MVEVGQRFGGWEVVNATPDRQRRVLCRCTCNRSSKVRISDLENSKSRLCRSCSARAARVSHGGTNSGSTSLEYNTWVHMIQRCYNPRNKSYKDYGARGITVCDLWRESFEAFYLSMGKRPSPTHTIERLNSNGNYEPSNCVWKTRQEQVLNQRSNVNLTIDGVTKVVSQWAEHSPVTSFTIYKRLYRDWSPEEAVYAPSGYKKGQYKS